MRVGGCGTAKANLLKRRRPELRPEEAAAQLEAQLLRDYPHGVPVRFFGFCLCCIYFCVALILAPPLLPLLDKTRTPPPKPAPPQKHVLRAAKAKGAAPYTLSYGCDSAIPRGLAAVSGTHTR